MYWQHFGEGQRLRTLVMTERGDVTGILPFVVRPERTRLGYVRFATYPLDHWGSFYGPIGADPYAVLDEGLEYFRATRADWDVLEPRWIGAQPNECALLENLLRSKGHAPLRGSLDCTSVVDLDGDWKSYLASRDGKWRNNARRWERQLNQLGDVTHFRYRPELGEEADPGWQYYDECLRIAASSWQGSSTTGTTLTHDSVSRFLRDVHVAATNCGCLDLNLLRIDGQAVAFTYNYAFRGKVYSLRSGYDPACPVKGAGSLLYVKAIEDSFRRGDRQYDLGPRHLECKRKLLTRVLPVYRITCFKRWSLRQQLMRLKRNLQRDAEESPAIVPNLGAASLSRPG